MSCGLSEDEIYILNILYFKHCFSSGHEMNSKLIKKRYDRKGYVNFDGAIRTLLKRGYIVTVPKKDPKYYIPRQFRKEVIFALSSHGYDTTLGIVRPLKESDT